MYVLTLVESLCILQSCLAVTIGQVSVVTCCHCSSFKNARVKVDSVVAAAWKSPGDSHLVVPGGQTLVGAEGRGRR